MSLEVTVFQRAFCNFFLKIFVFFAVESAGQCSKSIDIPNFAIEATHKPFNRNNFDFYSITAKTTKK